MRKNRGLVKYRIFSLSKDLNVFFLLNRSFYDGLSFEIREDCLRCNYISPFKTVLDLKTKYEKEISDLKANQEEEVARLKENYEDELLKEKLEGVCSYFHT